LGQAQLMSSKKNNTIQENFEDAKGLIRSRKLKEGQCNGQKKKNKRTSNDLQNTTQKTSD